MRGVRARQAKRRMRIGFSRSAMSMKILVAWVDLSGLFQELLALVSLSGGEMDYRSVEKQVRVSHTAGERFTANLTSCFESAGAIQGPGERILGGKVGAQRDVFLGPFNRLDAVSARIGIKCGEVVVVVDFAARRRIEIARKRLVVPRLRPIKLAHERVKIAESLVKLRQRRARDHRFV